MYGKAKGLTFFASVLTILSSPCPAQESQIVNGQFDGGIEPWLISESQGFRVEVIHGAELSGPNSLMIDIFDAPAQETIVLSQSGLALTGGATYHLSFTAKAQDFRQIGVLLEEEGDEGWSHAWHEWIDLKPTPQSFTFRFIHGRGDAESATLNLVVKHPLFPLVGEDENIDVYIDDVSFVQVPPADPNLSHYPLPVDGAIHEAVWANLTWSPGFYAASHDLYFGDSLDDVNAGLGDTFRGNYNSTSFVVGFIVCFGPPLDLYPGTTYYWRIDEVNDLHPDSPWKGDVWSFTVPPRTAYDPTPADGSDLVDPNVTLGWQPGCGAELHAVYFGDNFDDVNDATGGQPREATTYTPGPLELGKTYYWRIDEFDGWLMHRGDVWSFTTVPLKASNPDPSDGSIHEDLWAIFSWSPGYYAASHDVYISRDLEEVKNGEDDAFWGNHSTAWTIAGFPDFTGRSIGLMEPGATIYWRVDEVNDLHPDSPWIGDVWSFTIRSQP